MNNLTAHVDVIVVGAGASGMMAAITAAKRKLNVCILEKNNRIGKKILISGGGHCNFTNYSTGFQNFVSEQVRFTKFALSEFSPQNFIRMIEKYEIQYYEKHLGQLFCRISSKHIVNMLAKEADSAGVNIHLSSEVIQVERKSDKFIVRTKDQKVSGNYLIIASGGLSFSKLGISDIAYRVADFFHHNVSLLEPALVPFILNEAEQILCEKLSGIGIPVNIRTKNNQGKRVEFNEDILFTHRGISGPAVLQISLHWQVGKSISINMIPNISLESVLVEAKQSTPQTKVEKIIRNYLPTRVANEITKYFLGQADKSLGQLKDRELRRLANSLQNWTFIPKATEGFAKAEVTRGGVLVSGINPKTMESKTRSGLYFVGESVDVTGWLGGYNLQWAWASGHLAGESVGQ